MSRRQATTTKKVSREVPRRGRPPLDPGLRTVGRQVSLRPADLATLEAIRAEQRLGSDSEAIRWLIGRWRRRREAATLRPPASPSRTRT